MGKEDNVVKDIQSYIDQQLKDEKDFSVYELVSKLSAVDVYDIFKKHDYEMYYGSQMDAITRYSIAVWINNNSERLRDVLPADFPSEEEEVEELVKKGWEDDLYDMYGEVEDFSNDVQEICDIEFKAFRR